MKVRDFTTQLPGDEIFDPEEEAEIQLEVDRLMRENPVFSIDEIRENLGLSQEDLARRMRITTEKVAEFENLGSNISVWDLLNVINGLGFNLDIYAEYEDEKMKLCFPPGKEIEK